MKRFLMIVATAICFCGTVAYADNESVAKRTPAAPSIDGILNEECWKNASFNSDFFDFRTKAPAKQKTEFAFCFDNENLYLAVRCKSSESYIAVASPGLWNGDLIECFIDPGSSGYDYFHFAATPAGMIFKERGYGRSDSLWSPRIRAAGHAEKGEWMLEVAIPFADFQFQKKCNPMWRINIVRLDQENGSHYYTWASSFGDLHQVSTFQPLKGIDVDTSRFLWEITLPGDGTLTPGSDLSFELSNHSETVQRVQLTMQIWMIGQPYPKTLSLGTVTVNPCEKILVQQLSQKIPGLALERGAYIVSLEGRDAVNNLLFRSRNYEIKIPKEPMLLSCAQKFFYRNETVCRAEARIFSKKKDGVNIRFSLQDASGKPKQEKTAVLDKEGRASIEFDLKSLAPGEYKIIADWQGHAAARSSIYMLDRKLENTKVSIRGDGVTLVDGKPFFPMGLFMPNPWYGKTSAYPTDETDWNDIKNKGFNLIKYSPFWMKSFLQPDKNGRRITAEERRDSWSVLDRINKTGLKVAMVVNQFCLNNIDDSDSLRDYVSEFRGHPAILCWYLADEPDLGGIPPQRLEKAYRIIKELDPSHPVCILVMGAFASFRNAGDIMMADKYPIRDSESRPHSAVYYVSRAGVSALKKGQAFWMTPQFFCNYPQEEWKRCPTAEEEILMSFQAVCAGAKGLMYFAYSPENRRSPKDAPSPYPLSGKRLSWELWEGSRQMNHLLAAAAPFILDGTAVPDITVEKISGRADELQSLSLRKENEILVILCNSSEKASKVAIRGLSSWKKVKHEGNGINDSEVKGGSFITELPPWSTELLFFSRIN